MITTSKHRLIGPAALALQILNVKAARLREQKRAMKALLHGPMGTAKTEVALRFAIVFAGHESNIEHVNGKEVTVDFVREFKRRSQSPTLFGNHILIVDECDKMTADAKDLLLSVLDQMPEHCAFIGTTNRDLVSDTKLETGRFQTRLHCIEIGAPLPGEIEKLVKDLNPTLPTAIAATIAKACDGCTRSALIDAENYLDTQTAIAA